MPCPANVDIDVSSSDLSQWIGHPICDVAVTGRPACDLTGLDYVGDVTTPELDIHSLWMTNNNDFLFVRIDTGGKTNFGAGDVTMLCLDLPGRVTQGPVPLGCSGMSDVDFVIMVGKWADASTNVVVKDCAESSLQVDCSDVQGFDVVFAFYDFGYYPFYQFSNTLQFAVRLDGLFFFPSEQSEAMVVMAATQRNGQIDSTAQLDYFMACTPYSSGPSPPPSPSGDLPSRANPSPSEFFPSLPHNIGGVAWTDVNRNGVRHDNEPTLSGVHLTLLDANGNELARAMTDANGKYQFTQLDAGDYYVVVGVPDGFGLTRANFGGNDRFDSDFIVATSSAFVVISGYSHDDVDVGFVSTSKCQLYDLCGVCEGNNSSCTDCLGVVFGNATMDDCGVCNGKSSTCCADYCEVPDCTWDQVLVGSTVDDMVARLQKTYAVLTWIQDNLPNYSNVNQALPFGMMAEVNQLFLSRCAEDFCEDSSEFIKQAAQSRSQTTTTTSTTSVDDTKYASPFKSEL